MADEPNISASSLSGTPAVPPSATVPSVAPTPPSEIDFNGQKVTVAELIRRATLADTAISAFRPGVPLETQTRAYRTVLMEAGYKAAEADAIIASQTETQEPDLTPVPANPPAPQGDQTPPMDQDALRLATQISHVLVDRREQLIDDYMARDPTVTATLKSQKTPEAREAAAAEIRQMVSDRSLRYFRELKAARNGEPVTLRDIAPGIKEAGSQVSGTLSKLRSGIGDQGFLGQSPETGPDGLESLLKKPAVERPVLGRVPRRDMQTAISNYVEDQLVRAAAESQLTRTDSV